MKKYFCDKCPNQEMVFMGTIHQGQIQWYQCENCGVDMTREANAHAARPFNAILNRFSQIA